MSKVLFTQQQIEQIIYLYTIEGKTQKEIGPIMGCGIKPIIRILHEYKIPTNIRRINRRLNEHYFDTIDNENKAYLIGLLFADGNVSPSADRETIIRLQLLNEDINLLNFFKQEIQADGSITDLHDGTSSFSIRSNLLAAALKQYNIIPNKTYSIEHLPQIPSEFIIPFLRGYIDGDGSLYFVSTNNSFHLSITSHFISITNEFCQLIYNLLNIPTRAETRKSTYYNNVAKFTLNGIEAYQLAKLLYTNANIYCKRKYEKFLLAQNIFE